MANWTSTWDDKPFKAPPKPTEEEEKLVDHAKEDYTAGQAWEAQARINFDYDYKFANGDDHNKFQWDNDLIIARELEAKPCLTINKVQQHNLMVINDAKQNKPGVRIRPVGDDATFEGAQIYQELIYHIEYISSAENVYDNATSFQVQGGWGYWHVDTDFISDDDFDQEIYVRKIKDPRSVYLDPNINETDGSDARWGIIFEDMPKSLYQKKWPKFASLGASSALGNNADSWITKDHIRVAKYYYKEEAEDTLVTWTIEGKQFKGKVSELEDELKPLYQELKKLTKEQRQPYQFRERDIVTDNVKWCKIAGDRIIEKGDWAGKYIPIVRLVGTETVIDGTWDCKGHTRALINAQQMFNYNTSANTEYGALQSKVPWVAASAAVENFEEYYKTANRINHAYLPYNAIDDDGNPIPAPTRPAPPQASEAYVKGMEIAENEMMMASGQYQAQFGENENAKSGVAINARQRQGDRATYHFIDNQAIAIRFTGKILIDLIPKIYDTPRIKKILAQDGTRMNVKVDIEHQEGLTETTDPANPTIDNGQKVKEYIFNPDFGMYDIQADTGPSFATKRMETANILTQIASQQKEFLQIGGDILFKNLDFAGAEVLAQRYFKALPPALKGEAPDPHLEQAMHQAADMIQMLQGKLAEAERQLKDKTTELTQKGQRLDLDFRDKATSHAREDYRAETDRAKDLFNTGADGSGVAPEFKEVVRELVKGMLNNGELNFHDDEPPVPGAKKARDGNYYVQQDGQWNRVEMQ